MTLFTRSELVYAARNRFTSAKDKGVIPPHAGEWCVDCGMMADGYDHRDYRKPLDVEPICIDCNNKRGPGLPLPEDDNCYETTIYEVDWYRTPLPETATIRRRSAEG